MTHERCKHDLPSAQCGDCRPVPTGLTARVAVTRGGQVFHRSAGCRALREGQRHIVWRGGSPDEAVVVSLGEAQASGRAACIVCFPHYRPGRGLSGTAAVGAVPRTAPPRSAPPRSADPLEELATVFDAARRSVAAAIASGVDRRRLVSLVSRALLDIRGQVWPGAGPARLPVAGGVDGEV